MMDCLGSMAPNDEELLSYALDGEPLSEEKRKHLEHCDICQQRLTNYTQTNTFLISHLYRSECPSPTKLTDYCASSRLGLISSEERMRIASHISICPLCSAEVAAIRSELAKPAEISELSGLAAILSFSPQTALKRIVASLQPPRPQLVTRSSEAMGARPRGETSWPKHYKAEALDLSLHLSRGSNGETMLLGLFTSADPDQSIDAFEGCTAELYTTPGPIMSQGGQTQNNGYVPTPIMTTQVDDLGNIVFKSIPSGQYIMLVRLPETEIVIEGINIE